jgi:5-methylcytosine-specific restriction protein A
MAHNVTLNRGIIVSSKAGQRRPAFSVFWRCCPVAIVKSCPKCGRTIPHGWSYCPDCKPIAEAEREAARERKAEYLRKKYNARYNARRDPKYSTFYRSKAWRATSRAKLQSVGYQCEGKLAGCQGIACEVHHIKPIQTPQGWDMRLEWDNLEALCTSCHNGRHPEKFQRRQDDGIIDLRTVER